MVTLFSCAYGVMDDIPHTPHAPELGIEEIKIQNVLDGKEDLTVHCKSKDDDLGVHVLPYKGTYSFKFSRNFRGTTLFFCGFKWGNQFHRFDIYTPQSPKCNVPNECLWFIIPSGPCRFDKTTFKYSCSSWN
ncbi:S-protein homolog 5-like [Cannabis sativa]|nr:S-protein homolog 5-like [Cannabis sativa]